MARERAGKRVAFVIANEGTEQVELTSPWDAVRKAGGGPVLVAPQAGKAQAFNHLDKGEAFNVDFTTAELKAEQFDASSCPEVSPTPTSCAWTTVPCNWSRTFLTAEAGSSHLPPPLGHRRS